RPWVALAATGLTLAACPFGIRRLVVQDSWISGFARESDFYRATQYFNQHFFGTHMLLLALDTGHVDLRGPLPVSDLDAHDLRLPKAAADDVENLEGCSLVISRRAHAATMPDQPTYWEAMVERVARSDSGIVVTTRRGD